MTPQLFTQLGNLFYAIAKADNNLSFDEYVKLSSTLEKHWSYIGKSNIQEIKAQVNALQKRNNSATESFNDFITYLHDNPNLFDENLGKRILTSVNDIAYAYAKINKSELHLVAKLSMELKKVKS